MAFAKRGIKFLHDSELEVVSNKMFPSLNCGNRSHMEYQTFRGEELLVSHDHDLALIYSCFSCDFEVVVVLVAVVACICLERDIV